MVDVAGKATTARTARAEGWIRMSSEALGLDHAGVSAMLDPNLPGVRVEATATTVGRTGVEMEALTAVTVALLTVYDMVKSAGHALEIGGIRLLEKTGGRSGDWKRNDSDTT
jgi:cyclic pyranopterin phosphate synthase